MVLIIHAIALFWGGIVFMKWLIYLNLLFYFILCLLFKTMIDIINSIQNNWLVMFLWPVSNVIDEQSEWVFLRIVVYLLFG